MVCREVRDVNRRSNMLVPAKAIWKSKTFWFNLVGLVILAAEYLQTIELGEPAMQALGLVLVIGNGILRILTKQPVSITGKNHGRHVSNGNPAIR